MRSSTRRNSAETRVALIELFNKVADAYERSAREAGSPEDALKQFRATTKADYLFFLVKEASGKDGMIVPEYLLEITTREIAACLMAPDDGMHTDAIKTVSNLQGLRAELLMQAEKQTGVKAPAVVKPEQPVVEGSRPRQRWLGIF